MPLRQLPLFLALQGRTENTRVHRSQPPTVGQDSQKRPGGGNVLPRVASKRRLRPEFRQKQLRDYSMPSSDGKGEASCCAGHMTPGLECEWASLIRRTLLVLQMHDHEASLEELKKTNKNTEAQLWIYSADSASSC